MHATLPRLGFLPLLVAALLLAAPAIARENTDPPPAQIGDRISWVKDVPAAFEKAQARKMPVMICINARLVDDGRVEPAAKGLRDVIYKDPRVVTKSRKFVCVFLTSEGSSADYGELRLRFGIDGKIVSPQHVFARHDHQTGATPLFRKQFWPYGQGKDGVPKLLEMMDKALAAYGAGAATVPDAPDGGPEAKTPLVPNADPAPLDADARAAWIQKTLTIAQGVMQSKRREALRLLVTNDKDGDCITPLIALLPETEASLPILVDFIRVLGRPKLEAAAEPINVYLKHKDESVRANAAVSLEYIGSATSVKPLTVRAKREKVEIIANHMYRALGRCGASDSKVRTLLTKQVKGAKSESAAFGPIVGLAYFEGDAKTARAVEKLMKQIGPPSMGRRGGFRNNMKRTMLGWCLSEIADPKSKKFIEENMLKPLARVENRWIDRILSFYEAIADSCGGDKEAKDKVEAGVAQTLEWSGGTEKFRDEACRERDVSQFEPKAEWEVEGRSFGGRGGRGGGGDEDEE